LGVANQKDFLRTFQQIWREKILTREEAAQVFSTNAAGFYKLPGKGRVETGFEADLLLINEAAELQYVSAGESIDRKRSAESQGNFFHHPMILADVNVQAKIGELEVNNKKQ